MRAALHPGAPGLLAQVAPLGERQEGQDRRARERDRVHVAQPALDSGEARGGAHERGQAGKLRFVVQHERPGRFVVQHVLAEGRAAGGKVLRDLRIARLRRRREQGAGAHEVEVHPLEHAQLLGVQLQLRVPGVQGGYPLEQACVHVDGAVVRSQQGCHLALHLLQFGRGVGGTEVVKQHAHPRERPEAALEGRHRVVEAGRLRVMRDAIDGVAMLLQQLREGGAEMFDPDLREWRQAIGRGPGSKQGIGGRHGPF